ncbi:AAA domain-containing protein/AAA_2 domain-containing protein/ClpB_D2-small domain-containing protein, partial [Cephalotus follicularis]
GKLDPLIGRQQQLDRVIQILLKRRKNNPLLLGDPGVGKTVIVEGLAQNIINATVPLRLRSKKVFAIEMGRLIAGASNRGDFEERLIEVVNEVKQSNGSIIIFIDEVHTLIGAADQTLDAANILKPALARGELMCIGATTLDEYRKYIEKDAALKRRFQPVDVPEPSVDEAIEILKSLCDKYEAHHDVQYSKKALEAAAKLSNQYINDRFLPDKAIDLIDEAGARVQLQLHQTTRFPFVTEEDIQHIISMWTGIPVEKVSGEESSKLLNMEKTLHKHIIGQHDAVEVISRAIRRARVGIRDPNKPIASFFFLGPTGVGKTELANALAVEYFGSKGAMIRVDMSEFMEKHTVSKLIGSPPGYVGYSNGGQLTEAVRRRPHTVILFDEIEKAHRDVLNIFLQILDDGRLTDNRGQTIDFKNTIIIMTSNIGDSLILKGDYDVAQELKSKFRQEFLNRIDELIIFRPLDNIQLKKIVDIMLKEVYERLGGKNIELEVTDKFKDKLVQEGYNPSYGARPLKRTIVRLLEDNLAEKILSGAIKEGDCVTVDLDDKGNIVMS